MRLPTVVILTLSLLLACSRDPQARKLQFLNSGNSYFQQGKYREATIQYLNAIKIDQRYAEAHYRLAQVYRQQGFGTGAYQELITVSKLQPDNLKAQIDLGNLLLSAKEFKQAQARAEGVLARDLSNVDAHILLANAHAGIKNFEESLREMQTAIQLAPDLPNSYLNMAYLQLNADQAAAAENSFLKALSLEPKAITTRVALGNFYRQQKRWAEAEHQFRQAVQIDPRQPAIYGALAALLNDQGQRAGAEQVLAQAKQAMPNQSAGYCLLGDFYFFLGDLGHALQEYEALFQQHPRDERVEKNYIKLLVLSNRLEEAATLNDKLLKDHERDVDGLILRGQILHAQRRLDQAAISLETAIKWDPENPMAHYSLGLTLISMGSTSRGISELQQATRWQPGMAEAYKALAAVALRTGDMELLRDCADSLIAAQPRSPEGYLLRATASSHSGRISSAEKDLSRAILMAPKDSRPLAAMGQLRSTQKRFTAAAKLFEQALTRNPRDLQALAGLAQIQLTLNNPARAAGRVKQQISKVPDDSGMYQLLGQIYTSMKDYAAAEQAIGKVMELSPNSVDAILMMASVQRARGLVDLAAEFCQRAIEKEPQDARPYVLLGSLRESQGKWQDAQQQYQKALALQPDHATAANNLSYLLIEHGGDLDLALSLAQSARRAMPELANTADTLGWAHFNKGHYGLSVDLIEDAVKASPANPTYRYHLGMAYRKNSEPAEARQQFEHALRLNPQPSQAEQVRKALAETIGNLSSRRSSAEPIP